ncbi:DUF475 domain-containing protein [Actinomadura keratinilytica]
MFLYLEVLDASFSFDGVIGAFAITNDIVLMALGLGIGAMYVRSLTVYLVRQGTLDDYVYLEHGAHYAIGALAVILLVTIRFQISEMITGLIGVVLIGLSFWSSVRRNKRLAAEGGEDSRTRPEFPPESDSGPGRGCDRARTEERSQRGGCRDDLGAAPLAWAGRENRRSGGGMSFWDGLLGGRNAAAQFDSGSVGSNSIRLTKRQPQVSLVKQGAATGNLRVNLSWQMR